MKTIRSMMLASVVFAAAPAALRAQQTPAAVVQAYFGHFRAGEMAQVASLTHPRALESFRGALVKAMAQGGGHQGEGGLPSLEAMRTMPADSAYVWFLKTAGHHDRTLADVYELVEVEPVGHVQQGDSLAHVVFIARMEVMGTPVQQTLAMTVRRHGSSWLVDPGNGWANMMGGPIGSFVSNTLMDPSLLEVDLDEGIEP